MLANWLYLSIVILGGLVWVGCSALLVLIELRHAPLMPPDGSDAGPEHWSTKR